MTIMAEKPRTASHISPSIAYKRADIAFIIVIFCASATSGSWILGIFCTVSTAVLTTSMMPDISRYQTYGADFKQWRRHGYIKLVLIIAAQVSVLGLGWLLKSELNIGAWLVQVFIAIVTVIYMTQRGKFEKRRMDSFAKKEHHSGWSWEKFAPRSSNAKGAVLWSHARIAVLAILIFWLLFWLCAGIMAVVNNDVWVDFVIVGGSSGAIVGATVSGILIGAESPNRVLGKWLLYGGKRKTWAWATILSYALPGILFTAWGVVFVWSFLRILIAKDFNPWGVLGLMEANWFYIMMVWLLLPLKEIWTASTKHTWYLPITYLCVVVIAIMLAIARVVFFGMQVLLGMTIFGLWALDFYQRSKTMTPKYPEI